MGGSRPGVAHGARDQISHQRDLELVVVQGRGAAGRRLTGELGMSSPAGLPLTIPSTAVSRRGTQLTPPQAMRQFSITPFLTDIAAATLTSGKSQVFRSATFSK